MHLRAQMMFKMACHQSPVTSHQSPVTSEYTYGINRKLITIAGSAGPQTVFLILGLGYGLNPIPFGASWDLPSKWRR